MPLTLVRRAGADTLGKLESAARLRLREAEILYAKGESLGAIYLYGYSVEIRLKAAYYRTSGLVSKSPIDYVAHRHPAEDAIKIMPGLAVHPLTGGPAPGHHVVGWAKLLEAERALRGRPMAAKLAAAMHDYAIVVFDRWAEFLRYRANRPYNEEVEAVRTASRWFEANAQRLWR